MKKRDWPPCEVCGDLDGQPHHGNANKGPARAGFKLGDGRFLLVCRRCYLRMNRRRKNGQDPLSGSIRHTEKARQRIAKQRRTKGCPLCRFVPGAVPGVKGRLPKCSLFGLGGGLIFVCLACYKWAKDNPDLVNTMTLDELRWRRKKMAQEYYRDRGDSKWKTFWCAKKGARACGSHEPPCDGR